MRVLRRLRPLAGFGAAAGAALAGGAYALAIEPGFRLEVRRYRPSPPARPAGFRLRIGIVADPHAGGPHMLPRRLEGIVEAEEGLRPDLVVVPGGLNASHRLPTERVPPPRTAAILARLRPPLGVQAVLGNHGWWGDPLAFRSGGRHRPETEAALLAAGILPLRGSRTLARRRRRGCHRRARGWLWRSRR